MYGKPIGFTERDAVDEYEFTRPQPQKAEMMTPTTPFAALIDRCGLSQREAAEFLKVRLDTVKSWCAGRNVAKPAVLAELRGLYINIEAAAEQLAQDNQRLLEQQRERCLQPAIVFGIAETDDVASAYGFPSKGPYMAAVGLALLQLPDDVTIETQPQSYPGEGGGGVRPMVLGTKLTWPPSRKANRHSMKIKEKTAEELADIVAAKANLGHLTISVYPDPAYGWHATVVTTPTQAVRCQQRIDQIVAELSPFYKLKVANTHR